MKVIPISRYAGIRRKQDLAYHRQQLDRLIYDLSSDYDRLQSLVEEMRNDGLTDIRFHAIQALPALKQAETALERAKGKCA